jgi:hypothetical protein
MVLNIFSFIAPIVFLSFPLIMGWGWVRWATQKNSINLFSILSLIGFVLATASESLAIAMVIYARVTSGFDFYDPTLMRIYAIGTLLSLVGLIFAIVGTWKPSSLRWFALVGTVGTLCYWLVQAASE